MKLKLIGVLAMFLIAAFAVSADNNFGNSPQIDVLYVKVNGDVVTDNQTVRTEFERGSTLDIIVKLQSQNTAVNVSDVEVSAFITGFDSNDDSSQRLSDTSEPFNIEPDVVYTKTLKIDIPEKVDKDSYKLRVIVSDRYSSLNVFNYNLLVSAPNHDVEIKDIVLTPSDEVVAGRSLIGVVRIKNLGDSTEDDLKVKLEIPELGVSATEFLDKIDADKTKSSEELFIRIPSDAKAGTYTVKATVWFNNDDDHVSKQTEVVVKAGTPSAPSSTGTQPSSNNNNQQPSQANSGNVVVNVDTAAKVVTRGEGGAIYPITITNNGAAATSFNIDVDGVSWATVKMSPSNVVVVNPGESRAVYLYVTANEDASVGEHMFSAAVKANGNAVQTVAFKADVIEAQSVANDSALKNALQWVLVILVVALLIVAIVFGIQKARGSRPGEEPSDFTTQTYY